MSRRSSLRTVLPAAAAAVLAAACTDRSPTLGDGSFFPGGAPPVTLEAEFAAADFFELLGAFTGYGGPRDALGLYWLAARDYGGSLNATSLLRFEAGPDRITYSQGGTSRTAEEYTFAPGRLVVRVDSLASDGAGPVTLQLWALTEDYDPRTATWELAVDSAGEQTPWTQPGGTRGVQLGEGVYTPSAEGDSLVIALDSLEVALLADTSKPGVVLTALEAGSRVQLSSLVLRTGVHPGNASPDTVVSLDIRLNGLESVFVFTPGPPSPAGTVQAGGILGARTLFRLDLDRRVPSCPPGTVPACPLVPLNQVSLNRVSLLLDPVPVPGGFAALDSLPLTVRTVSEPELGRVAPLGDLVVDPGGPFQPAVAFQVPGASEVEIVLTTLAARVAAGDSIPDTFALLSEPAGASFGVGLFDTTPRLRVIYTLPVSPRLP